MSFPLVLLGGQRVHTLGNCAAMAFLTSSTVAVSGVWPARSTVMGSFRVSPDGFPAVEMVTLTMLRIWLLVTECADVVTVCKRRKTRRSRRARRYDFHPIRVHRRHDLGLSCCCVTATTAVTSYLCYFSFATKMSGFTSF